VLTDVPAEGAADLTLAADARSEAALETPPPQATASEQAPEVKTSEARAAIFMLRF
jgi:hypothetical protein